MTASSGGSYKQCLYSEFCLFFPANLDTASSVIPSNPGLLPSFLSFFLGLTLSLSSEEVKSLTQSFQYSSCLSSPPPDLYMILNLSPSSSILVGDEKHYFTEILHP